MRGSVCVLLLRLTPKYFWEGGVNDHIPPAKHDRVVFPERNNSFLNPTELHIIYIMLTLLCGMAEERSAINPMITMT